MKINKIALLAGLFSTVGSVQADEGQWQPHQLKGLQSEFDRVGIELPAEQVADLDKYPLNAVVSLGYCSASFVSPKALVVTNHHCAYGAIQNNSTARKNLIKDGFLAKTMQEELPAGAGERLYITEEVRDVTKRVLKIDKSFTGKERYEAIQNNRKSIIAECETDKNYRCSVKAFHHGMEYFLLKQLIIRDVRLVYAPPESIGNYGGDIDNFEYPRHTGDYAFVRGYVGKDGKPAEFSKDNVPYKPKSYLKVNAKGVEKGDGILLAGYPGRTSRYKLAKEIEFAKSWAYPEAIAHYKRSLKAIAVTGKGFPEIQVTYASTEKSINNRLKKRQGLLDGFKATDIVGIKREQERELLKWSKKEKSRAAYVKTYHALEKQLDAYQTQRKKDFYINQATNSDVLYAAQRLYRFAKERAKPDAAREIGYQDRDLKMFEGRLKRMQKKYHPEVDVTIWAASLKNALQNPSKETKKFIKTLGVRPSMSAAYIKKKLLPFYDNTKLSLTNGRLYWLDKSAAEFEKSKDPFIMLAVKLYDMKMKQEAARKEIKGQLAQIRPDYMKAIIAYNESLGKPVYPDANSTLRVTYGTVDGYPAADGIYKTPFTSLRGLVAKNTNKAPFNAPQNLVDAYERKAFGKYYRELLEKPEEDSWLCTFVDCYVPSNQFNSVPVNFLSSADTTGGNSGSPVMNGRGELVGLNFDSTYESITKDWYFNPKITRAIHVDIRYVLWLMAHVHQADNLIKEMDIIEE